MMVRHPLSRRFGDWSAAEYQRLVDDINANGLHEDIVTLDGMVLDGWHRYRACVDLMIEPRMQEFDPTQSDPEAWTWGRNHVRRHSSPSVRAIEVAQRTTFVLSGRPRELPQETREDRVSPSREGLSEKAKTTQQAAIEAGVSAATMERARAVVQGGHEDLVAAVSGGHIAVKDAAEIAKASPEVQKREVARRKAGRGEKKPPIKKARPEKARPVEPPKPAASDLVAGDDLLKDLARLQEELKVAQAEVAAISAEDQRAESLKWRRIADGAMRKQSEAMLAEAAARRREEIAMRQLRRCGKSVGEDDPEKIAAAVEAFVRANKREVKA